MITTGNYIKTTLLMVGLMALFGLFGYLLGGQSGLIVALIFATVTNFFSYWFSDSILLKMYRAQPVNERQEPRLHAIVRRLCGNAGLPMPKLYILPEEAPNAFATGRNPRHSAVAVTQGLLRMMNDREIEGVVAHELAHIKNRDILIGTIAATFAGAIMMLANIAQWSMFFGGFGGDRRDNNPLALIGLILSIILMPFAAILVQAAISRSREYGADATGARFAGSPDGLASALRKLGAYSGRIPLEANAATAHMFIVKPLSRRHARQAMLSMSTHPPLEDRIRRLREMRF
ncbi:zinc metalloprotease HtpX [Candidatus Sumerlaeota bacterium]|nr:zinc metalloprotease HtpX [Candidatus Sumerlaeota bacterium]